MSVDFLIFEFHINIQCTFYSINDCVECGVTVMSFCIPLHAFCSHCAQNEISAVCECPLTTWGGDYSLLKSFPQAPSLPGGRVIVHRLLIFVYFSLSGDFHPEAPPLRHPGPQSQALTSLQGGIASLSPTCFRRCPLAVLACVRASDRRLMRPTAGILRSCLCGVGVGRLAVDNAGSRCRRNGENFQPSNRCEHNCMSLFFSFLHPPWTMASMLNVGLSLRHC